MDLGTIIGFAVAFGALLTGMIMGGQSIGTLINIPSIIIVGVGAVGAAMITTALPKTLGMFGVIMKAVKPTQVDAAETVASMVDYANRARREGLLALEAEIALIDDHFLKLGLQLVVDGTPPETVREILETEITATRERHKQGVSFLSNIASYSPALGVIGTVMGLIAMLQDLSDPGAMGPAIATAFLTTLYGAVLANIVYGPLAVKLQFFSEQELLVHEMAVEGIMALQAGDNPFLVQAKMAAFLPAKVREQLEESSDGGDEVAAPAGEPEMVGAE